MAKVWINPAFKDTYKKEEPLKEQIKKPKENKKTYVKKTKKDFPQTKKIVHSENYFNKRIRENDIVEFTFINNMTLVGSIEWFNQRYIKIKEAKTSDDILIDRRPIKYIKKYESVKSEE
ncbi:MAG TPA: hypothetical protein PL110_15915 [Candidatus Eremiobacteraeota bacterium]|nr:MAG: hypothetical protein BWY64_02170 [bacterium ADurb.Bin363]HPZ09589.1 hypothetical protein [Candidatus Eremiobacteraeota bacterium]